MKSVNYLSETEKLELDRIYKTHTVFRVRSRAQAILLNSRGYSVEELQTIFEVRRDTISAWIVRWNKDNIAGLIDESRSGRPPIFTPTEQKVFKDHVDKKPHQLKEAVLVFSGEIGKTASLGTYKRILKKTITCGSDAGTL
jgi:transposase